VAKAHHLVAKAHHLVAKAPHSILTLLTIYLLLGNGKASVVAETT
jgi:hypothetical protein